MQSNFYLSLWFNYLVRKEFVSKLASDPKSCLSPNDSEISRKSESLLNTGVTYRELRDSKGYFYKSVICLTDKKLNLLFLF